MQISRRFENPNGRTVERIAAECNAHGPVLGAADYNGQHILAIVFQIKAEDGRTVQLAFNQADLAFIADAAKSWEEGRNPGRTGFTWAPADKQL